MPTTTNFGWTTPADTDLVKDGAAAIRTLGNGVDTSLVDLKGGTTGQILSKASGTDLDYTWITPNVGDITEVQAGTGISVASGTGPIPVVTNTVATEFDAKGDLVVGTGADTFDRLAVGSDNSILVADSSTSTGLKWAAPSGSSGPAFRVYRATSAQSFNASTFTKVQFNGETFDTDNCFDSTTNYRFTPTTAGYYSFQATIFVSKTTQNRARGAIYKNGSIYSQFYNQINTSTDYAYSGAALIYANGTTDYFEFFVLDEDPTSREVNFGELGNGTYWSGVWIRS